MVAKYTGKAYTLNISNINNAKDDIVMLFDTGAMKTVLPLSLLTEKSLSEEDRKTFENRISNDITKEKFSSVSGINNIVGYLCKAENVIISGMHFKTFYYYLIVDELCKSALIGDDFISCCRFRHSVNSDIEISDFDEKEYINKHEKYALTGKEILAALSQDTSKRKYTAQDPEANFINGQLQQTSNIYK